MTGIATVVAAALSLIVVVTLVDLVLLGYTQAVVRAAAVEGARTGARADDPPAACEARAAAVLGGLLGGIRSTVTRCEVTAEVVRARVAVPVVPWWPGLPAWTVSSTAGSVREVLP